MKKKLFVAILCGAMVLSLVACRGGETTSEDKPVKKYVKQITYNAETGEKQMEIETRYDEKGRETYIKTVSYNVGDNQDESSISEKKYNWIEEGNTATAELSDGSRETLTYDEDGNLIKKVVESKTGYVENLYTYENGVIASQKQTTYQDDVEMFHLEISYDSYGNTTKYMASYPNSELIISQETSYEYDKDGNILQQIVTASSSEGETEQMVYNFNYDENGFVDFVEMEGGHYNDYTCDKNGKVIEVKIYEEEILISEVFYEYYE